MQCPIPFQPQFAPANTLTPFGFSVYPDGTAAIIWAHSNQDGLFRNGAFTTRDRSRSAASAGSRGPIPVHGEYWQQDYQPADRTGNNTVDATVAATVTAGCSHGEYPTQTRPPGKGSIAGPVGLSLQLNHLADRAGDAHPAAVRHGGRLAFRHRRG